ncbi:proteinase inhibitor, propeptide [Pyronema omphalodes]|nr:proteinase inhibitor, propeptide [Pyronema omphalodes]
MPKIIVTFKENATDAERKEAKEKAQAASVDPSKPLDEYNIGSFKGFGVDMPDDYVSTFDVNSHAAVKAVEHDGVVTTQ